MARSRRWGQGMTRFIKGLDRDQATLFPECLDDAIDAENPVRVVDAFIDALDLAELGFDVLPEPTGRPGYHPATLLKLYLYGYLNQIQSSRRLERECRRNIEIMWLVGQLTPDFKTIADFRKDNGPAIRDVCRRFVALCRGMHLLDEPRVAIDGSKFKAVNNREKNFTHDRLKRRMETIEQAITRYLSDLDRADRQAEATGAPVPARKLAALNSRVENLTYNSGCRRRLHRNHSPQWDRQGGSHGQDGTHVGSQCPCEYQGISGLVRAKLRRRSRSFSTDSASVCWPDQSRHRAAVRDGR